MKTDEPMPVAAPVRTPVKILVVEDDMLIAAKIAMQLTNLGYEVTGIVPRGEEAIRNADENRPDIVLMDIQLKGTLDGIDTAHALHRIWAVAVIYVTANTDEATFNRAKATRPYAFIAKPLKNLDLQRAIELTISLMVERGLPIAAPAAATVTAPGDGEDTPVVLNDRIFVRHRDRMVRVAVADILYLEADRNYCHLITQTQQYTLSMPLKTLEDRLTGQPFLRVHRSFAVNLLRVDEVTDSQVIVSGKAVPLSHLLRDDLLRRIQMI